MRFLKVALAFTLAFLAPLPSARAFVNPQDLDVEYELDRLMADFPWAWRDALARSANAFQITGGSLNIRHFYIDETMKVRLPLVEDRFWFRFNRRRLQGLERNDAEHLLEFEYSPLRRWFLSLTGAPDLHKADSNIGVALRFGMEEGRSVKLTYLWPHFDNNYAFHDDVIDENYKKLYRRLPQEARLALRWTGGPWSIIGDGRLGRAWELDFMDFDRPAVHDVTRGSVREASFEVRRRGPFLDWALEGETWRAWSAAATEPADPLADISTIQERSLLRPSLEKAWAVDWRARLGAAYAASRGADRNHGQPPLGRSYRTADAMVFASVYRRLKKNIWLEGGYIYDNQRLFRRNPGVPEERLRGHQKRGKTALQWDFPHGSLRFIAGWELDSRDVGRYAYFDGGTIQFQTEF